DRRRRAICKIFWGNIECDRLISAAEESAQGTKSKQRLFFARPQLKALPHLCSHDLLLFPCFWRSVFRTAKRSPNSAQLLRLPVLAPPQARPPRLPPRRPRLRKTPSLRSIRVRRSSSLAITVSKKPCTGLTRR